MNLAIAKIKAELARRRSCDPFVLQRLTKKLPLSLTSFAPGSTAQERRAGNF